MLIIEQNIQLGVANATSQKKNQTVEIKKNKGPKETSSRQADRDRL